MRTQSPRTRLEFALLLIALASLSVIAAQCEPEPTLAPVPDKPQVVIQSPAENSSFFFSDSVPIRASTRDATGILRVDLVADGVIVHTQPLAFASITFDYAYNWKPVTLGPHTLVVLAYNSKSLVSDAATVHVTIVPGQVSPTAKPPTPTLTPFVIVVTATLGPSPTATWTPRVLIVTPTRTVTPTRNVAPTSTLTPNIVVVTNTPAKAAPSTTPTVRASATVTATAAIK